MENLTVKQKIILGIVLGVMIITIGIYGFFSFNSEENMSQINNIIGDNELIQEETNLIRK